MLLMLLVCMLMFFAVRQAGETPLHHAHAQASKAAVQQQSLVAARSALLAFANRQGVNSHTHPGHMPCPALFSGGAAQTSCLNRNWGWLPGQAVAKINHLNPGLALPYNALQLGTEKSWQYAVSAQLIQTNALGWSQWVDFSLPSLTVIAQNTAHAEVAAVVAHRIEPLDMHSVRVEPPYTVISVSELQASLDHRHAQDIAHTLWLHQLALGDTNQWVTPTEHLISVDVSQWQPVDPGCSCRCTRTRCTCQCTHQNGQWSSLAPCASGQAHCIQTPGSSTASQCTSATNQPCVFMGTAQLQSQWPIARFLPVPGKNRACQPVRPNACPLSALAGQSCECNFGWPIGTLTRLEQTRISIDANKRLDVAIGKVPRP